MAKAALVLSFISYFLGVQGSDDSDALALLQTRAKLETKPELQLAPKGWSDAFMDDHSKMDLSLAPQGWSEAQTLQTEVSLRLAPEGFSNATDVTEHKRTRSGLFNSCGAILHWVTDCNQCGINFCATSLWQANSGSAEAGYTTGSTVPLWGCSNVPANPYVIRNSGNGAIYVVENPASAGTLHHVTACNQCDVNFCANSLWQANSGNVEADYTVGSTVPSWGCSNVPSNPYVIRNSGSGAIYVVEKKSAGTLHHVTACNQCNVNFCANSLWQDNSGSAEAGYDVGSTVPEWGCSNVPSNPYVIRNSGSGAIYVVEMESAGTLHHVTTCNQCDVNFCANTLWQDNSASATAGYDVGSNVPAWGCNNVPANPYVIRNSGTGAIYVAEVCQGAPTPKTTTTTTVVPLDGLDDGTERAAEITDEQTNTKECKTWCTSKKHKDKSWDQKCTWFACSACNPCLDF